MTVLNPLGGGGSGISFQKFRNGSHYFAGETAHIASTVTFGAVANTLYGNPILIAASTTLSLVSINVNTAGTATLVRLGVYNNGGADNNFPVTLVADFGTVAVGTSGIKTISGLTTVLTPGLYFLAALFNGTATIRGLAPTASCVPLGVQTDLLSGTFSGALAAQAFGALPATFGAGTPATLVSTISAALIYFRPSSF